MSGNRGRDAADTSNQDEEDQVDESETADPDEEEALDANETGQDDVKSHLLALKDVHFRYPSRPEQKIFRGLDLHVEEGETLALVGPR